MGLLDGMTDQPRRIQIMTTNNPPTREQIQALARAARVLGAEAAYDDCIGGDLRAPCDASDACRAAVDAYRTAAIEFDRRVHGPARAYYFFGK